MGNFDDGSHANYNNAINYQIISRNAEALNLKCPSYYKLTRMAQEHGKDKDAIQSFSTLFMELNGYNGVNVSITTIRCMVLLYMTYQKLTPIWKR